jgi:CheY-like chemotaxis protein
VSAASVEEVVAILEHELRFPDAIVTDYRLGDRQTGLDVIAAVRQYTGEKTPAVIVTGEELEKAGLEIAGSVYPVIKKPLSAEQLRRYLVAAVRRDFEAAALNERIA